MTIIQTLRFHWENLRMNGDLPLRSTIDPRQIPDVLDSIFILERLNPMDVRVRFAGLTLCEMMGMEVRGQSPMTFFDKNTRRRFEAVLVDVMNRPNIARLGLGSIDKMGNEAQAEMTLLPLRNDFGDVSRIIGCVTIPTHGFTAPVRFKVQSVDIETSSTEKSPQSLGFAESKAGFIMDGSSTFHAISGGKPKRPKHVGQTPMYLKLVD
ncbi:MAG: PAS domain-containing protein [Paracoccaceae bacterium]